MLRIVIATTVLGMSATAWGGGDNQPPFDFSDAFYIANGIDPTTLIGRPDGTPPNSVIDNRENGPDFNNVRLLSHTAAYDHSGHPIFFYVTGLPTLASFLDNEAGREALEIAETYNVYEFPRAGAPEFSVFPKRQDLIADLRDGYFSNDPLGTWRINIVSYTDAARNTPAGRAALDELAARNGRDLDGTPIIRTISEIEDLHDDGFVTIVIPPADRPGVLRWFFCPVIEDPRRGAIAPDAFLEVIENDDAHEFIRLFNCLQRTGEECNDSDCEVDWNNDDRFNSADFFDFLADFFAGRADFNNDNVTNSVDFFDFLTSFFNPSDRCD